MRTFRRLTVLPALVVALVACAPTPGGEPVDAAQALALVVAQDPRFAGIEPRDPNLIGQSAWTEVTEIDEGWQVVISIGWGDCPAGCINEHRWTFLVTFDGDVIPVDETGDPLPEAVGVQGIVVAGPTCPVVTDPPDPSCADRAVSDAELVVTTPQGDEVGRTRSDADGRFTLSLSPGSYVLVPQPVEGLMGSAEPQEFSVAWEMPTELVVSYDTGIR